jgi:hypothetical protein
MYFAPLSVAYNATEHARRVTSEDASELQSPAMHGHGMTSLPSVTAVTPEPDADTSESLPPQFTTDSSAMGGGGGQAQHRSARELYDEHVALSKRIQRQQLAAMLGIGLDFDINNPVGRSAASSASSSSNRDAGAAADVGLNID